MKLLFIENTHYLKDKEGCYWTNGIIDDNFISRYQIVFNEILIVARVMDKVNIVDESRFKKITLDNISFIDLPAANSSIDYVRYGFSIYKTIKCAAEKCEVALIRLPCIIGFFSAPILHKNKKKFAIEMVANPKDAISNIAFIKKLAHWRTKKAIKQAQGISYVTKEALQRDYPSNIKRKSKSLFIANYTSLDVEESFYATFPKIFTGSQILITHIANKTAVNTKGHDIVIKILAKLRTMGYNVSVKFIGDSDIKNQYFLLADQLGVRQYMEFTGMLSEKKEIRKHLVESSIFVFPTKFEGLPRVLIEAMAVGLPCLSTNVGGIPELLDSEFMFSQNDVDGFTKKIIELISNTDLYFENSKKNIELAKDYSKERITTKRTDFYMRLRKSVEEEC